MSLFEFSDISKSEETIQRTWEDFSSALATGVFSYNELDAAKANTTFLKVFDDLFSHCHPFFDVSAESILACPTTLMRAGRLRPADPDPTYSRFIPNKDYITKPNRFSPPGVEWLYLAITKTPPSRCGSEALLRLWGYALISVPSLKVTRMSFLLWTVMKSTIASQSVSRNSVSGSRLCSSFR